MEARAALKTNGVRSQRGVNQLLFLKRKRKLKINLRKLKVISCSIFEELDPLRLSLN